jgi:hypothetical protein
MQFFTVGICDLCDHNISYLFDGWVNASLKYQQWLTEVYFVIIAVKKSCTDTREKCVFMEKARDIAMDLENPLKLTTEGIQILYSVLSKLVKYRSLSYTSVTFYV